MTASQFTLKAVPIWAEQVPTELADIVEVAGRWGAEVRIPSDGPVTITLSATVAPGAKRSAVPGEWLMDRPGEGKGCCTNEEFVASFDPVTP